MKKWNYLLTALGIGLLLSAVGRAIYAMTSGLQPEVALQGVIIEAILIGLPGIVLVSVGVLLFNSPIASDLYSRIVGWTIGGIVVASLIIGLRELHPGVNVDFTGGTQLILLSISSVVGLLAGVQDARTQMQAKTLEQKNKELKQKYELEKRNEKLKQTEKRLEQAVTELEASNERLEEFAYAVSHDLQEPLRMVTSYLKLLENRYGEEFDEDGEEFIEFAVDGAERMRSMIDGLLEYSRIETQGDPFDTVDLDSVLDDVFTDLQFKIEGSNTEIERDLLPTVEGDENQLRQVFQNLLSNAIEYSGDQPPQIYISSERDGEMWTLAVHDEGIGIDSSGTDRIFNIFQRLQSDDEQPGSGIGLAVCRRIIERHNGEIWVESEPGEGSSFFFTLPDSKQKPAFSASGMKDV
ncbi:ATP-binding protein (plasmid) [Natrinema zhouii]|uniref:sensor histidine kinase n=1 Tax=Natrinema zhouii TaxID=1710539 RepID=UPI001CFFCE71|nr:ATP-binding protein [Natrinema zhouii]UHQ98994.1 ATP-binding protein [Natrinema zhouii]